MESRCSENFKHEAKSPFSNYDVSTFDSFFCHQEQQKMIHSQFPSIEPFEVFKSLYLTYAIAEIMLMGSEAS